MAGGYRAQPRNGFEDLRARQASTSRALAAVRTAASVRQSSISGGKGLLVGDAAVGPTVRLVTDDSQARILFNPPASSQQQDWAASILFNTAFGTGGGSLSINSPAAPVSRFDNQPAQIAALSLASGDGVNDQATAFLDVGDTRAQVSIRGGLAGIIGPSINLGGGTIQDDSNSGASYRFFMGLASIVAPYTVAELRVRDAVNSAYVPIRASAFTVTSSRDAKDQVADFGWSPLDVVRRAKAQRWHYRPEHGDPDRVHFGPMAEDLPEDLVDNTSETPAIDLAAMVGVLWGAVQELAAEVAQLRKEATA
jgi:hypothetical protein